MVKLMSLFLAILGQDGPAHTVEPSTHGFLIVRREGYEEEFNRIARRVIDESGPDYSAFPRSDRQGGYDCVHVIPHD